MSEELRRGPESQPDQRVTKSEVAHQGTKPEVVQQVTQIADPPGEAVFPGGYRSQVLMLRILQHIYVAFVDCSNIVFPGIDRKSVV